MKVDFCEHRRSTRMVCRPPLGVRTFERAAPSPKDRLAERLLALCDQEEITDSDVRDAVAEYLAR